MNIEIDRDADAAYIYFKEIQEGEVKNTVSLNDFINVDLNSEGKVIGIEILDASNNLSSTLNDLSKVSVKEI